MSAPRREASLVALAFLGFASLGLPDGALGVAWPSVRATFALPLDALGALLAATVAGAACASFCAGALLARLRVGALLALSCAATGLTLLGFAAAPRWAAMVALGVCAGLGAGAIDAGINTFAATRFAPRTLHWLHAAYGLGASAGPALMARALASGAGWRGGYAALGVVQLALAGAFAATLRRWPAPAPSGALASDPLAGASATLRATLRLPAARFAAAAFFLYLGVEATAGAWLYSLLRARGLEMGAAAAGAGSFWAGLLAGRIAFGFAPNRWAAEAVIAPAIGLCTLAALGLAAAGGAGLDRWCAIALGLGAAPIYPALIGATPKRVGPEHTANAVGLQVAAAALGQASLPALVGVVAARASLAAVPAALVVFAGLLLATDFGARRRPSATTPEVERATYAA